MCLIQNIPISVKVSKLITYYLYTSGCKHSKVDNPYPYLVFSECDSKLYTNFEFCEERNHIHFRNMIIYKAKKWWLNNNNNTIKLQYNKSLHILEDDASGVQVGDIEQVIV